MDTSKKRLIELALRGLELEKENIENEISSLRKQLRLAPRAKAEASAESAPAKKARRIVNISPEEAARRSERMKAYWDNWRKQQTPQTKGGKKPKKE
jgi:hypothetical protein